MSGDEHTKTCPICGGDELITIDLPMYERDFVEARALSNLVANRASSLSTVVLTIAYLSARAATGLKIHSSDAMGHFIGAAIRYLAAHTERERGRTAPSAEN
jgi:hypothetical protein